MNNFQFTGYVKTEPQRIKTDSGQIYVAVILTREKGKVLFPVYYKNALARDVMDKAKVGSIVNVEGRFASEEVFQDYACNIRQFNVGCSFVVIKAKAYQIEKNVVYNKLLMLEDEDDLFKKKRRKKKNKGEKSNDK